jgi:hypothetical protein
MRVVSGICPELERLEGGMLVGALEVATDALCVGRIA